uniref:Uncharacterized protein n=1 Tax=Anguilla anguilla TaxID=7936 RepID=A0A0E9T9L4_ANGAN
MPPPTQYKSSVFFPIFISVIRSAFIE